MAVGVEQQDLVVDGVLVAVLLQPPDDAAFVVDRVGDEVAQVRVGGEETDVGGALVEVAHDDVDHVLGAGLDLPDGIAQFFQHQTGHEVPLHLPELGAGGGHGGQDGARVLRAVHLGRRLDQAPHQVQLPQRHLAARYIAHVRQQGLDLGAAQGDTHLDGSHFWGEGSLCASCVPGSGVVGAEITVVVGTGACLCGMVLVIRDVLRELMGGMVTRFSGSRRRPGWWICWLLVR